MLERITGSLAREALEKLDRGESVDRTLMPWGRLRIERFLPFLCVYRRPVGVWDHGTRRLVTTQPSYLLAPGDDRSSPAVLRLVETLAGGVADACGGLLLLELWSRGGEDSGAGEGERADPGSIRPSFRVHAPDRTPVREAARRLARALGELRTNGQSGRAEIRPTGSPSPPRMPVLDAAGSTPGGQRRAVRLGLEVTPVYRELDTGELFPFLLDELRRKMAPALTGTMEAFVRGSDAVEAGRFPNLARTSLEDAATEVDRRLSGLTDRYDLLLEVSPVDSRVQWEAFRASGFEREPEFHYRPLRFHPASLKRELFDLPVDDVEEPLLARLFREKQEEVSRHLTMLLDRGTRSFLLASRQLYGELGAELPELAETLLERIEPRGDRAPEERRDAAGPPEGDAAWLGDREIVAEAQKHLDGYRAVTPAVPYRADLRDDIPPGLLVSRGRILVGKGTRIRRERIDALMHHEVGTHMVTYYNGNGQPLQLLRAGLAGYEPLQEALAVLAEHLVGGLTAGRLRTLAARVVAVRALIDGADFVQVHRLLRREHGCAPRKAYSITMRVFRSGGFTKDMVYLQGLVRLVRALRKDVDLDLLLLGKISLDRIDDIEEFRRRGVLSPPTLRPAYLDMEPAGRRLERIRRSRSLSDLLEAVEDEEVNA